MMTTSLWRMDDGARQTPTVDMDKVKILVIGEPATGKSAFVQTLCGTSTSVRSWTVGASVEVFVHSYCAGTPQEKDYFVELFDIGGSRSYRCARSIFYNNVDGVILIHDLTNKKTSESLRSWLLEVLHTSQINLSTKTTAANSSPVHQTSGKGTASPWLPSSVWETSSAMEQGTNAYVAGRDVPIFIVGSKCDQMPTSLNAPPTSVGQPSTPTSTTPPHNMLSRLTQECTCDEIWMDCRQPIAPGSTNSVKLSRYFDKVVEYSNRVRTRTTSILTPSSARATTDRQRRRLAYDTPSFVH